MITKKTGYIIALIPSFIMGFFGISWVISFIWGIISSAIINANLIEIDDTDNDDQQDNQDSSDDTYKAKHEEK